MGYIRKVKKVEYDKEQVVGATCDFCSKNIQLIDNYIFKNALNIGLTGGYGMYYDGDDIDLIICGDCARQLLKTFPTIQDSINKSYGI